MKLEKDDVFGKKWEDVVAMGEARYFEMLKPIKVNNDSVDMNILDIYDHFFSQSLVVRVTAYINPNDTCSSPTLCQILYYNCDADVASHIACELRDSTGDRNIITVDSWDIPIEESVW